MPSITLNYVDTDGSAYTQTFSAYGVKGFDALDNIELFPNIQHEYLDGSFEDQNKGFRRLFTIDLGVLQVQTDRKFVLDFLRSNSKTITYTHDSITETALDVVNNFSSIVSEWSDGLEVGRRTIIELKERYLRTSYPTSNTPTLIQDISMYIKKKVAITGTKDSPQTLTTGTSPLNVDQEGNAFPSFSNINKITVLVDGSPYQEASIFKTTQETLSSNNITFGVAHADVGSASSDDAYYADITILVKQ